MLLIGMDGFTRAWYCAQHGTGPDDAALQPIEVRCARRRRRRQGPRPRLDGFHAHAHPAWGRRAVQHSMYASPAHDACSGRGALRFWQVDFEGRVARPPDRFPPRELPIGDEEETLANAPRLVWGGAGQAELVG